MKNTIEYETNIGLNGGSYRTTIPQKVIEYIGANKDDKIKWIINIKDNSLSLAFKTKENTISNIDVTE